MAKCTYKIMGLVRLDITFVFPSFLDRASTEMILPAWLLNGRELLWRT